MDNVKINDEVLDNLSRWTLLNSDLIRRNLGNSRQIERMNSLLDLEVISRREAICRRILHKILLYSPSRYRYNITDFIKKLRQLVRKDLIEIPHCLFVSVYLNLIEKFNVNALHWKGFQGCVCLTHDVDSKEGYEFVRSLLNLEKSFSVRSTYNFLGNWGYAPQTDLLSELSDSGFEVGLHGWTHDIALGCRNRERIKREISCALERLALPIKGFRAPAFSVTKTLLEVLSELGIRYDSSMKVLSCYGQGVETPYPYKYPGIGIWEIPLTIQDDRVFRDLHLSCEEGLGVIKELIQRVIRVGGVAVVNTHPRLVKLKYSFYNELLVWLVRQSNILLCPMNEIIDLMEERERRGRANVS